MVVQLSTQEKGLLRQMIRAGRSSAQAITWARILLKTDEGWTASQVAVALDISERARVPRQAAGTPRRDRTRCCGTATRSTGTGSWTTVARPTLIALACSSAPEGHDHWTLRLLAGKAVELGLVESLSHETVAAPAEKTRSSRGGSSNGASRR